MLKIYFDNVLIDDDNYTALSNEYKLFTDSFKLGSVACNTFKLSVNKSVVSTHPTEVKIEDDNTTFYLVVDSFAEDRYVYNYTLVDKLMLFNFYYDASEIIEEKASNEEDCYLSDILADMCEKAGVELDPDYEFQNDIIVNWYDNRRLARQYLSYIAELQYGYAQINEYGKLTFKRHNSEPVKTINIDECSDFVLGERKEITRVVYDGGAFKWEFGNDTGSTLYLNPNNVYITNEEIVENIYNELVGFTFYNVSVPQCPVDSSVRAGDVIVFTDGVNEYPTIAQYSIIYNGGWTGGYSISVNTNLQQETQMIGVADSVRNLQVNVDRLNNEFSVISEKVDDLTDYIRNIVNTGGYIKLSNTPESQGAINKLSIKGFDLMTLYPGMAYPSKYTYPGVLNFYILIFSNELVIYSATLPEATEELEGKLFNEGGIKGKFWRCLFNEENEEYEWLEEANLDNVRMIYINSPIPLYKVGNTYDELLIEQNKIKVIQRVGYNFDSEQWEVLSNPIIYELEDVLLPTFKEDTYITLKYFENLTYEAEYIIKNDFTSVFATQLENDAQFRIVQNQALLKVNSQGKIVIASLYADPDTGSEFKVESDNIKLEGYTTINGNFSVDLEGNATMKNATITGGNVYLPSGGRVIGGEGILTNLQATSNGFFELGYYYNYVTDDFRKVPIELNIKIPKNFTVTDAKVYLYHAPIHWIDEINSTDGWGYAKKIKLYKNSSSIFYPTAYLRSEFISPYHSIVEVPGAFGSDGFTTSKPTAGELEEVISIDIKNYLSEGMNIFVIEPEEELEIVIGEFPENTAIKNTSYCYAVLDVIGYIAHTEE